MNLTHNRLFSVHTARFKLKLCLLMITLSKLDIIDKNQTDQILKHRAWLYSEQHGTIKQIIINPDS